jgi:predicted Zn-dependent protease with MMP-like domain
MAGRKSVATLFVMLMISAGLSGCFGEESKEVLRGIPGGLTLACLSDDKYTSMVVEIDYEAGYMPEQSSTDLLKTRLEQVCDKPQGIEIFLTETNFDHEGQWSASDVREKGWNEKSNNPQSDSTLYWQAIFPSGQYANDGVLGVAVDASTIAIFGEAVDDAEGPIFNRPSAEEIENSVLVHEFGHLLGLVNLVYQSPVNHEDEEHKGHSNNEDSVMYWAIESANIGNIITGELPDDFDADDLNDLAGMLSGEIESNNQLWTN